jgi:large subunit ribosomal protein L25
LEFIELNATTRTTKGNGPARRLRQEGKTPAVLYGPDTEATMLAVDTHELELALKDGFAKALIRLTIDGGTKRPVMIRELQTHPVAATLIHADFMEIDMKRKITVMIPVVAVGTCAGVEMGGLLQVVRRELEVECLPSQIPEAIEVDVTELNLGDSVHVAEIPVADGVELVYENNFTVITVTSGKMATEASEEEEAAEGEAEEAVEEESAE